MNEQQSRIHMSRGTAFDPKAGAQKRTDHLHADIATWLDRDVTPKQKITAQRTLQGIRTYLRSKSVGILSDGEIPQFLDLSTKRISEVCRLIAIANFLEFAVTRSEYQNTVNEHQLLRKELLPVIGPLMKVNGVPLTRKEITTEAHPYATLRPTLTFTEAAYVRTTRTLLLHQAAHKEIKCPSRIAATAQGEANEEALMRALIDAAVPRIGPDEATCRTFYFGSSYQFRDQDLFEASHILLTADPSDKLACNEAVSRAELLIDELAQAPERFGLLARRWSNCDSKFNGGRLGTIVQGQTPREVEMFLYGAGEGQLSPVPIKSQLGVHVVRTRQADHWKYAYL